MSPLLHPSPHQLGQARQYWKQFQNSFKILSPAGAELGWLLLAGEHNDRSFLTVNFPHFRPELIKYLVSPHGFMNITVWQVNISNYENIPPSFSWWNWFLKTRHKTFMNISKTTWMKKVEVRFLRNEKKLRMIYLLFFIPLLQSAHFCRVFIINLKIMRVSVLRRGAAAPGRPRRVSAGALSPPRQCESGDSVDRADTR